MKKRLILYAIIFALMICLVQIGDICIRYNIGIIDYIRYSRPLTAEEKSFLKANTIKYGIDINDSPFAFLDPDTNQNTGIMVDYFNQLSVTLESEFKPLVFSGYNAAIELKDGNIDCSVLNMTNINNTLFMFTQPLYTERSKLLVAGESSYKKLADVHDMKIAVISGSTAHHAANEFFEGNRGIDLILTADLEESFLLFGLGEVDAIIGDEAKISYHLNQALRANRFRFLEGSISEENVAVAVNREQKMLFDILNKGILEMKKTHQYSHINSKWFASFIPETNESLESGSTANLISIIILLFMFFFIWNKTVANQVNIKTKELKASRQELRNLIDSLHDGIILYDAEGKILAANKTFAGILGIPFEDMFGGKINEIDELKLFLEHVDEMEAFPYNNRYYLVSRRNLNTSSQNKMILIKDYTERYKHERLSRQDAKMIAVGELSAGLAHEIRNPMGLIRNYLFVLKKKVSEPSSLRAVKVMEDSVDRINTLINNLLGFSRLYIDSATRINVRDTLEAFMNLKKTELEKKGITLNICSDGLIQENLTVNKDIFNMCIVNMINNSVDAFRDSLKKEKNISINVSNDKKNMYMTITDNAAGIKSEAIEEIFNPFYTTKTDGTGLGLYIIQTELRKAGGSITVESEYGEQTAFFITLPIEGE